MPGSFGTAQYYYYVLFLMLTLLWQVGGRRGRRRKGRGRRESEEEGERERERTRQRQREMLMHTLVLQGGEGEGAGGDEPTLLRWGGEVTDPVNMGRNKLYYQYVLSSYFLFILPSLSRPISAFSLHSRISSVGFTNYVWKMVLAACKRTAQTHHWAPLSSC